MQNEDKAKKNTQKNTEFWRENSNMDPTKIKTGKSPIACEE